jgi:hypothetical protein
MCCDSALDGLPITAGSPGVHNDVIRGASRTLVFGRSASIRFASVSEVADCSVTCTEPDAATRDTLEQSSEYADRTKLVEVLGLQ